MIDLSQAYLHMHVEEQACEMLTINTPGTLLKLEDSICQSNPLSQLDVVSS